MQEQAGLGLSSGIPKAIVQKNGDIVSLAPGEPGKLAEARAGRLLLDRDIIPPADGDASIMRRRIDRHSARLVVIGRMGDGKVESWGRTLEKVMAGFVSEARES